MLEDSSTVFVDACAIAGALKRNLLLTLAEAEFFRIRWSEIVLDETESAIRSILEAKGVVDAGQRASRARRSMEAAFEEAIVSDFEAFLGLCHGLPDANDTHVLAAALKAGAAVIVTDNLKHFPKAKLASLNVGVRSSDAFIADTIALDPRRALAAVRRMRRRLSRPDKTAELLLLDMDAAGLSETVELLGPHISSL